MNDQTSTAVTERKPHVPFANVPERQEAFLEALRTAPCYGCFVRAATKVNVKANTIYKFIERNPEFGDLVEDAVNEGKQEWVDVHVDHGVLGVVDRIEEDFYEDGTIKKRVEHRKTDYRDRAVLDRLFLKEELRDEDAAAKRMEVTHRVYHHEVDAALAQLPPEMLGPARQMITKLIEQQKANTIDGEVLKAASDDD